ncbi:MAG: tyrosine-type recombinase/integrase [Betaproteobacteria bacterium]|nr:tyrosine-type recombinase/integrase [Betaproteobacteria bacterium]
MGPEQITAQNANLEPSFPAVIIDTSMAVVNEPTLLAQAAEWFALDVANGDARPDTIKTYLAHLNHWFIWCGTNRVDPGAATAAIVKAFRQELVVSGAAHATISLKLTTIRRFYDGAVTRGLLEHNPAAKIKAPRNRAASGEIIKCLSAGEAELLFRAIPRSSSKLKTVRDRAMLALMMLEGLRRVEICRANFGDIEETATGTRLLVHGKGKDGYIYPREDTVVCIKAYLEARVSTLSDADGAPLFVSLSKGSKEFRRISRIGLSKWMDTLMLKAGITKSGRGCHALRHTCGSLLYQATRDVKVVQETLRHSSIAMAAKYSHIEDRGKSRYTTAIPVKP